MKNILKILGIITLVLIIGFSITACKEDGAEDNNNNSNNNSNSSSSVPADSGELVVTGLDAYNGNYAFVTVDISPLTGYGLLSGDAGGDKNVAIADNKATLKVHGYADDWVTQKGYTGSDLMWITFSIYSSDTVDATKRLARYEVEVQFSSGKAQVDLSAMSQL